MMYLLRLVAWLLLINVFVTRAEFHTCESDPKCAKVICSVFDNVCSEGELCEQLEEWPWFQCHLESHTEADDCSKCGHFNECHEDTYGNIVCTCEGEIYEPGKACVAREEDNPFNCGGRNCHVSAECIEEGKDHAWCLCPDGRFVVDDEICPGWSETEHTDSFTQEDYDQEDFDCSTCQYGMECWDADGNNEYGCYCAGRLVYFDYPCGEEGYLGWESGEDPVESYAPPDALEEQEVIQSGNGAVDYPEDDIANEPPEEDHVCDQWCWGMGAECFVENELPVCRCINGFRVARDENCN